MYVIIYKILETPEIIIYKFETNSERYKTVFGLGQFNKKTGKFTVNPQDTDKYFLDRINREIAWIEAKLQLFQELDKGYPDIYTIAKG